jgi:hypothetical protein
MSNHVRNVYLLFFFAFFSKFYLRKKIALFIFIIAGIVCIFVFHTHANQFLLKKNTHIPLFGYAQKNPILLPGLVSWLVSLYVCLLVGLLLGSLVGSVLYIIFIGNKD